MCASDKYRYLRFGVKFDGYLCFVLLDVLKCIVLTLGVYYTIIYYYIILYIILIIISYTILFPLPLIYIPFLPYQASPLIYHHLLSHSFPIILLLFLFSPIPSSSIYHSSSVPLPSYPHSKYTCRVSYILIYIPPISHQQSDPACFIGVDG